jgi:hypothetical protein
MNNFTTSLPYFAAFISIIFIVGFLFALGEKIGNNIGKEEKQKLKNKND